MANTPPLVFATLSRLPQPPGLFLQYDQFSQRSGSPTGLDEDRAASNRLSMGIESWDGRLWLGRRALLGETALFAGRGRTVGLPKDGP